MINHTSHTPTHGGNLRISAIQPAVAKPTGHASAHGGNLKCHIPARGGAILNLTWLVQNPFLIINLFKSQFMSKKY